MEIEALIEEARERQRRRRRRALAAVVAAALVGALVSTVLTRTGLPGSAASVGGAPLGLPADETTTVVAHFSQIHVGWVLVYADGRVVAYDDCGPTTACLSNAGFRWHPFERRLTPAGVDLVRSGAVSPRIFLQKPVPSLPEGAWADSVPRTYVPSTYAVCYVENGRVTDARLVVGRLPASVGALLAGKGNTYQNTGFLLEPRASSIECSEISSNEARALHDALAAEGIGSDDASGDGYTIGYTLPVNDAGEPTETVGMFLAQVLPHGAWVMWGG